METETARFRWVELWVEQQQQTLVLLSNHLSFGSTTIAEIHQERWQIKVSFGWPWPACTMANWRCNFCVPFSPAHPQTHPFSTLPWPDSA